MVKPAATRPAEGDAPWSAGSHHPRVKRRAAAGVQQCRSGEAATISLAGERLNVKWVAGVEEVDLVQGNLAMLTENLAQDMADLMHDFDIVSR